MERLKESQLDKQLKKKRGMYFAFAVDKPLSKEFNITPALVAEIRRFGVFKHLDRTGTIAYIGRKLENGVYDKFSGRRAYKDMAMIKQFRIQILDFCLSHTDSDWENINRITKWDWDYMGEDRKLPVIESEQS